MYQPIFKLLIATIVIYYSTTVFSATNSPISSQPMSPSDFTSRVDALNQQTKASLAQRAQSALQQPSTGAANQIQVTPAAASAAPTPAATQPTASSSQPYTGFGTTDTANKAASTDPKPSNSPGGWDIKY